MTDDRIITILSQLRKNIAGIYIQKKLNQMEEDTQNQDEFVTEIKTMFSDKSKTADAKWKIEIFKQYKKHITNFIIKFEALAIKAKTSDMHTIFLLKKNVRTDIIKIILGYSLMAASEMLREWKMTIILVGQGYKFTKS